jgi:hypothetical protein
MPAGRPAKPIEQKRLIGNPGRRPLPTDALELRGIIEIPEPSRPLLKYGREAWDRVWQTGAHWVSPNTDIELLLMTCEMIDERWNLRVKVLQTDDWRLRRGLREIERQIVSNFSLLGFSPSDRARLGVAEVKVRSKLQELMQKNERN